VNNREFFRPRGSVVAAGIAYALLAGMALQSIFGDGLSAAVGVIAWCTLFALIIYIVLHRPSIEIFDEGIRIHNPVSTIIVGWQDVDVIEAKYTAFLQLRDGKKISIWCAQTPGRYHSRTIHPSEMKGIQLDGFIRPGESPRTDSGVATYLCRTRLAAFRANGMSNGVSYLSLRENSLITALGLNALFLIAYILIHA
jgi:hypothetical protein